jgi:hypothetical protein
MLKSSALGWWIVLQRRSEAKKTSCVTQRCTTTWHNSQPFVRHHTVCDGTRPHTIQIQL